MSTAALQLETHGGERRLMPVARVLRLYVIEAKYETLRLLRNPSFIIPTLLFPIGFYLFFGLVLGGAQLLAHPAVSTYLYVNYGAYGVMAPGMFGFGVVLAIERQQGTFTLKRALPMPASAYLLAKMLMALLFAAVVMLLLTTTAVAIGHLHLGAARILAVIAVNMLGTLPFCAIGLFVGAIVIGQSAVAILNIIYLPTAFLGGVFFPLPKSMHSFAVMSPVYHLNQLGLSAAGVPSQGAPIIHIAVLAAVTVLFTALAIRRLARTG